MISAILLDIDGTLIDSNDAHAHAWVDGLAEFDFDVPFENVRPLIGMGGDKVLPIVARGLKKTSARGKALSKRVGEIFRSRYLHTLEVFPGTRELLEQLVADRIGLVVATSASTIDMRGLLEQAGIDDLIDDATTSSDAKHSKPDPDIIAAAVEKSGASPDRLLMLGDTPYDVAAAARAGVPTIALRCGGWWTDDAFANARAIYDHPADLLAGYETSPIRRR